VQTRQRAGVRQVSQAIFMYTEENKRWFPCCAVFGNGLGYGAGVDYPGMPAGWNGHFQKHELHGQRDDCDIDRPCSPRGRDGVLLVGASFRLDGFRPQLPQILAVGSYQQRTPMLVYK